MIIFQIAGGIAAKLESLKVDVVDAY